jgi:hypothetical protein
MSNLLSILTSTPQRCTFLNAARARCPPFSAVKGYDGLKCKMMARSSSARTLGLRLFHSFAIKMTLLDVVKVDGIIPSFIVRLVNQ